MVATAMPRDIDPPDPWTKWVADIKNYLNWRLVRNLGELQILTRISLLALVVVPALAAMWPPLAGRIWQSGNASAQAIDDALTTIEDRVAQMRQVTSSPTVASVAGFDDVSRRVAAVRQMLASYVETHRSAPLLPWSFAATFVAALLIVCGHFWYQIRAPLEIRRYDLDGFVFARVDSFLRTNSAAALERAQSALKSTYGKRAADDEFSLDADLYHLKGLDPSGREDRLRLMDGDRRRALAAWLMSRASAATTPYQAEVLNMIRRLYPDDDLSAVRGATLIEQGARAEYLELAERRRVSIIVCCVCYCVALVLIGKMIWVHAVVVGKAAGWTSIYDCLFN